MPEDPTVLFSDGGHSCLAFSSLMSGEGIQANQFLIVDGDHACIIDPGGELAYTLLAVAVGKYIDLKHLDYVFASHQDPDIIASLPRWLMQTYCSVACSRLWTRFLPHLASTFLSEQMQLKIGARIIAIPDAGETFELGNSHIKALSAHFLHSVGNFHFYDTTSKILFSGDMGASLVDSDPNEFVADFEQHIPHMEGFHRRYMGSSKASRLWANMVRGLDVQMLVPQHGRPFRGTAMINRFLDWISDLECGIDLLPANAFTVP